MDIYILCGGSGTRLNDYSFPKPLNMIYGKPSIAYSLKKLPEDIKTLHFIVAEHLYEYNFEEIIINTFKNKQCIFHKLPYFTRGPIESAWLGLIDINDNENNIVFLDNDVLYEFPADFFTKKDSAFLGYSIDNTNTEAYSFMLLNNNMVIDLKEKKRISNTFCCGVYGFKNLTEFKKYSKQILDSDITNELYMSLIFQKMLENKETIRGIKFNDNINHIGSMSELEKSWNKLTLTKMRICIDLDNTLVTYPTITGDYTTVKPIKKMIDLVRKLKSEGHTIIIHTARRMTTHNYNIGAVIKDIALITLNTLNNFEIPYDEIIFGKPIADIYIDDRAINPYKNSIALMGYLNPNETIKPINMLPTNKYNEIKIINNMLCKTGPMRYISGEIFYYKNIPSNSKISAFFPKFYMSVDNTLYIEHIKSIPFYKLYLYQLINKNHINTLFEMIEMLHNTYGEAPHIDEIKKNYTNKLIERFKIKEDYPFEDAKLIQEKCLELMSEYTPSSVAFIHGDLWFSNILVSMSGSLKLIDMRGKLNEIYTTGGDPLYDYAKLYQSILGFDAVLYNDTLNQEYFNNIKYIFEDELQKKQISLKTLRIITFSLVMGTLHFIESYDSKNRVWKWIKDTFYDDFKN